MKNEIILYRANEAAEHIEVLVDEQNETVWLSLNQISMLFERDKSIISRHLNNIYKTEELNKKATVAKNATTASDGKSYTVEHFNLEAILSVGYRVNSKQGTQFRIWANRILKDYLLKGYAINNRMNRLANSHDRFLIIDQKEIYHLGASLKDLGKKWFAFSKMDNSIAELLLGSLKKYGML